MELNVNPNLIYQIARKARLCQAQELINFPEFSQDTSEEDNWSDTLDEQSNDYTYQDVVYTINVLDPNQQALLVAIMYLGRGDYDVSEWSEAVHEAQDIWTNKTGEYLLSRPLVADYLEEGLSKLGCPPDD